MRFPPLVRVVRVYLKALDSKDAAAAAVAMAAMRRLATQRARVEGGISAAVLDYLAAHERGDKEGVERARVQLAEQVRPRHDDDGG